MTTELRAALRRNFTVSILDGGFFGFAMGAASFATVIPLFVSHLTDSAMLIALIPAIHTLGWQLPQLLTVQHVARLRRYLPFVLQMTLHERMPYLGLALVALFHNQLNTTLALFLTFSLLIWQGFGGGFTATAWQSMIAKIIPSHRHGLFFGTQSAAASLGGAIAAAVAGGLLGILAYPTNFAATFGLAFLAIMLSWGFLAATNEPHHEVEFEAHEGPRNFLRRLPGVLQRDPNFVWYLAARWMVQIGFIGTAFYSVYAVKQHGVSEVTIGLYTSLMLVTQMLANPIVGWLGDRWSHRMLMAIGTVALGLSAIIAWLAPSGGWFGLVFLLAGIAQASYWAPGIAILLEFAPARERQLYIGLANTLMAPAAILAPLMGGWLADSQGYNSAFIASAGGALLTTLLLLLVVRDPRALRAHDTARPWQPSQLGIGGQGSGVGD